MKRILIVEDNEANLELARQLLEDSFEILVATDGQEAVATAIREVPDLILMDLSLPKMDGWTATSLLRLNPRTRHVPIAALTAHVKHGARDEVLAAGFDAYISKPIEEAFLLATAHDLLERTSAPGSFQGSRPTGATPQFAPPVKAEESTPAPAPKLAVRRVRKT